MSGMGPESAGGKGCFGTKERPCWVGLPLSRCLHCLPCPWQEGTVLDTAVVSRLRYTTQRADSAPCQTPGRANPLAHLGQSCSAAEGAPGLGANCIAGIKVDCWEQGRPLKYVC